MKSHSPLRIDDDAGFHEVDEDGDNYLKEMTFGKRPVGVFKNESRTICCVSYLLWYAQIDPVSARARLERMMRPMGG